MQIYKRGVRCVWNRDFAPKQRDGWRQETRTAWEGRGDESRSPWLAGISFWWWENVIQPAEVLQQRERKRERDRGRACARESVRFCACVGVYVQRASEREIDSERRWQGKGIPHTDGLDVPLRKISAWKWEAGSVDEEENAVRHPRASYATDRVNDWRTIAGENSPPWMRRTEGIWHLFLRGCFVTHVRSQAPSSLVLHPSVLIRTERKEGTVSSVLACATGAPDGMESIRTGWAWDINQNFVSSSREKLHLRRHVSKFTTYMQVGCLINLYYYCMCVILWAHVGPEMTFIAVS